MLTQKIATFAAVAALAGGGSVALASAAPVPRGDQPGHGFGGPGGGGGRGPGGPPRSGGRGAQLGVAPTSASAGRAATAGSDAPPVTGS